MIEAAEEDAENLTRMALESAGRTRREAFEAGRQVRGLIDAMDERLAQVGASLKQEAQRLTVEMDRRSL